MPCSIKRCVTVYSHFSTSSLCEIREWPQNVAIIFPPPIIVIIITITKRGKPHIIFKKRGDAVPISFRPMRQFMEDNHISFYRLANEGIDAQTLQRIRHDKPITTDTLGKICSIMKCQPGDLIEYIDDNCESAES